MPGSELVTSLSAKTRSASAITSTNQGNDARKDRLKQTTMLALDRQKSGLLNKFRSRQDAGAPGSNQRLEAGKMPALPDRTKD
ncbi:MAG: hypothetical protein K2X77_02150 [Candidatus Obscuribacterales bacterium]|nr:hypothetical protein [Candidatus Obscuribacterales bacterium]